MSRRIWIAIIVLLVMFVTAGAVGVGGLLYYPVYKANKYLKEADAAYAAGQWRKAKPYYAWYIHKHPKEIEPLERYAEASLNIKSPRRPALEDAGRAYLQLAQEHPQNEDYATRTLQFYFDKELWGGLTAAADYMLIGKPDDPLLMYYKALGQEREGRLANAVRSYEAITDWSQVPVDVYGNYALLQMRRGNDNPDLTRLQEALEAEPDRRDLLCQRARILAASKDAEAAQADLAAAGPPDTLDYASLLAAIDASLALRDWKGVETYARLATALDPEDYRAYMPLAFALEQDDRRSEAVALLQQLPEGMMMDHPNMYLSLGEALIAEKNLDSATKLLETYRNTWPDHEASLEYLDARILLARTVDMDDEEVARQSASAAAQKLVMVIETNPDFARARYFQVLAYLQAGRRDDAQVALETYIRNNPLDQQARLLRENVFGAGNVGRDVQKIAAEVLGDERRSPRALAQAAENLLRGAGDGVPSDEQVALVEGLLNRAIESDAGLAAAYTAYIDLRLRQGDVASARALLDRGKAAGVDSEELDRAEVAVLLAERNLDGALERFASTLDEGSSSEDVNTWAAFFTARAGLEAGLKSIRQAVQSVPGLLDEVALGAAEVRAQLVAREMDGAVEQLRAMDRDHGTSPDYLEVTRSVRLDLVRRLLQDVTRARVPEASRLLDVWGGEDAADAEVQLLRAQLLLRATPSDLDGAKALANRILSEDPDNAGALLLLSDVASRKGYSSQAVDYARAAVEANGATAVRIAYAETLLRDQNLDGARNEIDTVLASSPEHPRALELSVRTSFAQGQTQRAGEHLTRLSSLPGDSVPQGVLEELRGILDVRQGNVDEALATLKERFESAPDNLSAARAYSSALAQRGDLISADQVLEAHATQRKDSAESWAVLGQFRLNQNTEESRMAASSAFTRALLLIPDYAPALQGLIDIHLRTGNLGAALGLCDRFLNTQPDNIDVLYQKASILSASEGNRDEALATIKKAIAVEARPAFILMRGVLRLDTGENQEALDDLQQVRTAQGVTTALTDAAMAHAYANLGETDRFARQYYDIARQKAGNEDPRLQARLATVAALLDKEEE